VCERVLKIAIRQRNNSLFYRTTHGARVGDIFMALIHTAQLHGAILDPAPSAFDRIVARESLARASAELDRCSPKARAVFDAVYEDEGASHAETAERLGLSVQRVRQTICEVRARLRAVLDDDEPAPLNFASATTNQKKDS